MVSARPVTLESGCNGRTCGRLFRLGCLLVGASIAWADARILLPGTVNDLPVHFAVDTGSGVPFCVPAPSQSRLLLSLGEKVPPEMADQSPFTGKSQPAVLQVLGRRYDGVEFFLLKQTPPGLFQDFDAILGWPAIRGNVLHFNLAQGVAEFAERSAIPKATRPWMRAAIAPDAPVLVLNLGRPEKPYNVLVDTGLDDAVHLGADEWQQWTDTLRSGAYTVEADYIPGQGVSIRHQILAREVQLGPIRLHQVMVSQAGEEQRKAGDIKTHAVIGLAALRELELYIDYPNRTAELRVTSKLKARPAYNRLGAVFVPPSPDSAARAAVVAPGSPAQEAGLRNGDVLLAIDEDRVSELGPLFELWRKPAGTPYVLHVKRGERTLALRVRLRDFLRAR
jgi:hypothetical protein